MGAKEQEACKLRICKNNMKLVAITAIQALGEDDMIDLCHSHKWVLDHFADVIKKQTGKVE